MNNEVIVFIINLIQFILLSIAGVYIVNYTFKMVIALNEMRERLKLIKYYSTPDIVSPNVYRLNIRIYYSLIEDIKKMVVKLITTIFIFLFLFLIF